MSDHSGIKIVKLDASEYPLAGQKVACCDGKEYLWDDLYAAFDHVCNKKGWKNPIDFIGVFNLEEANLVHVAIPFFTGGYDRQTVLKREGDLFVLRVTAKGYYHHTGA